MATCLTGSHLIAAASLLSVMQTRGSTKHSLSLLAWKLVMKTVLFLPCIMAIEEQLHNKSSRFPAQWLQHMPKNLYLCFRRAVCKLLSGSLSTDGCMLWADCSTVLWTLTSRPGSLAGRDQLLDPGHSCSGNTPSGTSNGQHALQHIFQVTSWKTQYFHPIKEFSIYQTNT